MNENSNTQQFIKQLAEREGVSEEKIKEIIIGSFRASYCQGENASAELHFEFDSGLSAYRLYKIVETVNEPEKEITKGNELLKAGQIRDGNLLLPIDIKKFSFSLNQEIKNRLQKNIEEISWTRMYKLYKPQQGEIIKGSIKGSIKDTQGEKYHLIDLGKGTTGYWAESEWTLQEEPRLGQRFHLLIKEVKEEPTKDACQIILTRSNDLFIRKLLEQEIPQIKSGTIIIRDILRLPGVISKVLVERGKVATEKRLNIDPAGACIGKGGERAKSISHLIYSEQIYFVDWTEDKKKLLAKLLSPVKLIKLIIKQEKEWEIVIPYQQKEHEEKMLEKISDYLGIKIYPRILRENEKDEILANKGQVFQAVGNYKNIDVQIVEEIEK